MCLIIKNRLTTVEKGEYAIAAYPPEYCIELAKKRVLTAEKDIKCYKTFYRKRAGYISVYQNFYYKLGFQYYQTGDFKEKFGITLNLYEWDLTVHKGLHSYTNLRTAIGALGWKEIIVECIIPKGSQYFIGQYNDYVSDSIILNKEVN